MDVQLAMIENAQDEEYRQSQLKSVPGKMKKQTPDTRRNVRDFTRLWNVPKSQRKEILKNRLSPKEFVAIFGRQFEPKFRDEGYIVTVPEPFRFGEARHSKYRKAFIDELVTEKDIADMERIRIRAKSVPNHVYQPIYRDMVNQEEQKKKDIVQRSRPRLSCRTRGLVVERTEPRQTATGASREGRLEGEVGLQRSSCLPCSASSFNQPDWLVRASGRFSDEGTGNEETHDQPGQREQTRTGN